jgi:hypothetical protein
VDGRVLSEWLRDEWKMPKDGRESPDECLPAGLYNCVAARFSLVFFFFFSLCLDFSFLRT